MTTTAQDYAKNHWRQYESPEDHAERVERAEHEGGRYFERATKRQKAAWDRAMSGLRGLQGPRYDRARKAANEAWARDTMEASDLLWQTIDELMRDGEVSEAMSARWDELDARQNAEAA